MQIYLIRHGETDWNKKIRFQGREDIKLNSNGIIQANECGQVFKQLPIDLIISSPLKRAKEMADIIASYVRIEKVVIEDDLIERVIKVLNNNNNAYRNVVMVSHGVAINAALAILSEHTIGTGKTTLKNASINVLKCTSKSIEIQLYNLTSEEFAKTVLLDGKSVYPASTTLRGEYGHDVRNVG